MGMAITAVWDQDSFRFRNDDGSETTATWMAAANTTPADIPLDTNFRLRFLIQETAGSNQSENPTWTIQYRVNSGGGFGAWTDCHRGPGGTTLATGAYTSQWAGAIAATQQLGSGTFNSGGSTALEASTPETGTYSVADGGFGTAGNDEYELEFVLSFSSTNGAAAGDIYEFRIIASLGTFGTYTNTPSVTVSSGTATQTITPNHIASGETAHNPTFIYGQTVAPNHIASAETVHQPTLIAGSVTVVPSHIASGETVQNPTLVQGAAQVFPEHIASGETVYQPTLASGAVSIIPDGIASTEAVYNPTLIAGAATAIPDHIVSAETVHEPTLVPGAATVVPDHIASGETVHEPTLVATGGTQNVLPDHIASAETVHEPTLVAGAATVAPDHVVSAETVHQPTLTIGPVNIVPDHIASTETVQEPIVASGQLFIGPDHVASGEIVNEPTLLAGAATVVPDHIASAETSHSPTIVQAGVQQTVTPDVITSGETVYQPTLADFTASEINVPGAGGGGAAKRRREAAAIAPFIRWGKKKKRKPEQVKEVASAVMQVVRQADDVPNIDVHVPVEIDYQQIAEMLLEQQKLAEMRKQQFDQFARTVSAVMKRAEREIMERDDEEALLMALY